MEVLRSEHAGFCFGVGRATRLAERLLAVPGPPLVTIGPLMHNPQEVERLARAGVQVVERIADCTGKRALVRTHGIGREQTERARALGVELIDATCPHVKAPRRRIEQLGRAGRTVVLVGDAAHPEVRAQVSYAGGPIRVVRCAAELAGLPPVTPLGVVAQTTLDSERYAAVIDDLRSRFDDVQVFDTICRDAHQRQQAGRRLAARVDRLVVVGGRNSANTEHLAAICRQVQPRTVHIETEAELGALELGPAERIGLTSGASTPEWLLDRVERALRRRVGEHGSGVD
jgi:4-hydroxy-3-methylbut-2-enyl diphosphate reductase